MSHPRAYAATLVPPSPWTRMSPTVRRKLIDGLWVVTGIGLLAGYYDPVFWEVTVAFTLVHALVFVGLVGGGPAVFPAQLRLVYTGWVALGTYVPALEPMMWIATAGLTANLVWGYCPLARTLYLLPWNRTEGWSASMVYRAFFSPPRPGRFDGGRPPSDAPASVR